MNGPHFSSQVLMSGISPVVSHSAAFACGVLLFEAWPRSGIQCPACEVTCGQVSCPAVTCTTGSINFEILAGSIFLTLFLALIILFRLVFWYQTGIGKGSSKGVDARRLGQASSWKPISG